MALFETVHDLRTGADSLRHRSYGLIVVANNRLHAVHLRPWPKLFSATELALPGAGLHWRSAGNHCWLYYNQPRRHRRFLALKYVVSSNLATFATFRAALVVLDEIARLKSSDAIVCEVRNHRISDRLLARWGWEPHVPSSARRHFIKRFYGRYPDPEQAWNLCGPLG
ncbi:MAG: hypothetical protein FJ276_29875 [Planctomycetes bacterium]|nr:hypothetical protein [Planctomycetota bacterium]